MKNNKNNTLIRVVFSTIALFSLLFALSLPAFAEGGANVEQSGEIYTETVENPFDFEDGSADFDTIAEQSGDFENIEENQEKDKLPSAETQNPNQTTGENNDADKLLTTENLFEEIYNVAKENSDKIFSILAFIGTVVVGVGYKSGLIPLLRDALSKLKGAIDSAKEENEKTSLITKEGIDGINTAISDIDKSVKKSADELSRIGWEFESYKAMQKERESMRIILANQIDMLYAIFMSSSLPQYQKDEIGVKIQEMREELKSYETAEN